MKDQNGNKITEHEFTKDIGHKTEIKTCIICGEKAEEDCGHCGSDYCEKHYRTTVQTGNCCRGNEQDYNYD